MWLEVEDNMEVKKDSLKEDGDVLILEYIVKQFGQFVAIPRENMKAVICTPSTYIFNELRDMLTVGLKVYLPMRELASYKWPATWWDAVKERFAYEWMYKFIARPKYTRIDLNEGLVNTVIPKGMGDRIRYMLLKDSKIEHRTIL